MRIIILLITLYCVVVDNSATAKTITAIDENWACRVKTTCEQCMLLTHCSWCLEQRRCFSNKLDEHFCENNTRIYEDLGFSNNENAVCLCSNGVVSHEDCSPADADPSEPQCSGRGSCKCGRCQCDTLPDPEHPSKKIFGEYCEFDNFSCDGDDCGEGPYPLSPPDLADDDGVKESSSTIQTAIADEINDGDDRNMDE